MKTIKVAVAIFYSCLIFYLSCSSPTEPDEEIIFPLKVGNKWEYKFTSYEYNFRPDSVLQVISPQIDSAHIIIEIKEKTILGDSIESFLFTCIKESELSTSIDTFYYFINDDKLFCLTPNPIRTTLPKNSSLFNNSNIISFNTDFITLYMKPTDRFTTFYPQQLEKATVFDYPLKKDKQWNFFTSTQDGWRYKIDKKVCFEEKQLVPAGQFSCFRIQWLFDFFGEGIWDEDKMYLDFVANEGLIQRVFIDKNIDATDETGKHFCTFDLYQEFELVKYVLK
jgi:hypothetical protein